MRFLADMGISPQTVGFLRDLGHDAVHLSESGDPCLPDALILEKARSDRRVLLTHDLDFGDLLSASGADLPSVVIFRVRNMHPTRVNRYLSELIEAYPDSMEHGAVISVTEGRFRVRALPLSRE